MSVKTQAGMCEKCGKVAPTNRMVGAEARCPRCALADFGGSNEWHTPAQAEAGRAARLAIRDDAWGPWLALTPPGNSQRTNPSYVARDPFARGEYRRESAGGPRFCQRCHEAAGQPKAHRPNPALILVTGNPAPGAVEKSWCKFHQRDVYDGKTESFGVIRGMPPFVFALGKCKSLEIDGSARPFTPQPWLVCSPDDESLWIVTKDVMNLGSGAAGKSIEAITYDPPRESGKTPAYYRHEFDKPLPVLTPVGDPHRCRAVLLDGGAYVVNEWIHK